MANQPETATYDAGVYQLEITDPVQGGVGGLSNAPLLNLADRTAYLKAHVDALEAGTFIPPTVAPLASPTFTGTVAGPTATGGDSTTKFATTAFVQNAIGGISTINCAGGANITLTAAQYGAGVIILTGLLTGNINVIYPTQGDEWLVINNSTGAFTITNKTSAGTGIAVAQGKSNPLACDGTNIVIQRTDFNAVALTGNSTAVTQTAGDNSTKIATTAFVTGALASRSQPTQTVLTAGTGATYTPPAGVSQIRVRIRGGGGGGGGGNNDGGDGADGGATTFNGVSAAAGKGGLRGSASGPSDFGQGGAGGTSGGAGIRTQGLSGTNGGVVLYPSVPGACSSAGGGGSVSGNGLANSGQGGNGGSLSGTSGPAYAGGGGGQGELVEYILNSPGSITYTIGTGGLSGTQGTGSGSVGSGGTGGVIVDEYY